MVIPVARPAPGHPPQPVDAAGPAPAARTFSDGFALLAECLLVGVYVLLASLPVVTLPAALAAGAAHLRRHLAGQATDLGRFARDWRAAVRELWGVGAAGLVLAGVLAVNVQVAASGLLPGGPAVRWLSVAVGAVAGVVVLRVSGAWSSPAVRDSRVLDRVARAARSVPADPAGSVLLVVAIGLCALLVWMLTPLVGVVGGLLCLAVVAVEFRDRARTALGRSAETEIADRNF
ncbi:hypothetical protein [Myceligenerans salitolerans]|uniref:Integral membrane protein n=1 Tax=Myceligenerans salitolerans TaxID=1230528 RepID=A0ABS3I8G3_9MICO|nr:hypothetical protein [Myceligenerans salitolerans]MBO0609310.1 hypothetical protein [Myceligenerans salitolerans]